MKKYLAIHEAPCVGTCEVLFEAKDDQEADNRAWEDSVSNPYFTTGGYDLYWLHWSHDTHQYILTLVNPEEVEA